MTGPSALTGTGPLFRLALRLDRVRIVAWIAAVVLLVASSYLAYDTVFPDAAATAELTASFSSNTAFTLLLGQVHDLATPGGFTAWRSMGLSSIAVSLMAIFTVVRHTRAEEDSGRAELVASGVVGRHAALAAAVLLAVAGCLTAAVAVAASLIASSAQAGAVRGADVAGALALGAAIGATGVVFAGVAAVTAQLGSFSRTASALAGALLGATYVLRGWGAATSGMEWVEWLSPFGWGEQVLPYLENRWVLLALPVAATVVLLAVAGRLLARRDLGFGIVGQRPGRATAGPRLAGASALSWRLSRGALAGWLSAFVLLGALYGSVTSSIAGVFKDNPALAKILQQGGGSTDDLTLAFVGMIFTILALVATLNGVQRVLHGRTEEIEGRAEPLLAASVSRPAWLSSHGLAGLVSSTVVYAAGALAFGVVTAVTTDTAPLSWVLIAGLLELPAIWVLVGLCVALLGAAPRFLAAVWVVVGATFVLTLFGPVLGLPDAVLDLSAFNNVPDYLTQGLHVLPLGILTAIAAALVVAGFVGIRRRDLDQH
ncbi:ABC-2 type transport system permease protein [Sanguibacter gelidistatuariae]|uniref:ABC-2 type transport system permease protein n=1 Tax=Sanguibacter gelidistatuariae TaxID=1814289 RepID=A0A1G6H6J7_9MICO|nr:hypothetical protein [Sanguibacter gelidistatuariae]SDB89899.1 ABC-2 type transport system permease protein [Sanguibacter gelidistatuariae]